MARHRPVAARSSADADAMIQRRLALTRRRFLALAGLSGAAVGVAGVACAIPGTQSTTTFPETTLAKLTDLKVGTATPAKYPDDNSPILIFKLGQRVPDGVGPDGDIVAFSSICTHLGCTVLWRPAAKIISCPCHYSSFDPARGGLMVMGQATTNLPQVILKTSDQNLVATGIRGLIWGRQSNLQMPS